MYFTLSPTLSFTLQCSGIITIVYVGSNGNRRLDAGVMSLTLLAGPFRRTKRRMSLSWHIQAQPDSLAGISRSQQDFCRR